jgi:hypothetical protein
MVPKNMPRHTNLRIVVHDPSDSKLLEILKSRCHAPLYITSPGKITYQWKIWNSVTL